MTMTPWVRLALAGLVALALIAAATGALARAAGMGVLVADPPFGTSVSCPAAGEQQEGTVPCS